MGQLVKILDYVSRYEQDLSRYPTQYIRLKTYQWERMKRQWEYGSDLEEWQQKPVEFEMPEERNWKSRLSNLFGRKTTVENVEEEAAAQETENEDFGFSPNIIYQPKDLLQLRKLYIDQLFHFQIKWASSTLIDQSRVDPHITRDTLLRSFAQQLPDSFLIFYYPILQVKKAPVELDILIFTPVECMCITVLENEDVAAFIGGSEKFWIKKSGDKESKVLNPFIALNRMEKIVSSIFRSENIEFPIKKYVISRNGYIDYPGTPFDIQMIDRRHYEEWFAHLKKSSVPMKFTQFKAAQTLLDIGQTTTISRFFDEEVTAEEENEL